MFWLQSQEELFNERKIKPDHKDIQKFLLYFAEILQIGVDLKLISVDEQIKISELISAAIERKIRSYIVDGDNFIGISDQIANMFYVLTLWLSNFSNYDNWCRLNNIRNVDDASILLDESREWFIKQLDKIEKALKGSAKYQDELGIYKDIYQGLRKSLYYLYGYDNPYIKFSLKQNHKSTLICQSNFYVFLNDNDIDKAENYVERLKLQVKYFRIESSILVKVNAKSVFEKKRNELDDYSMSQFKQIEELDNHMEERRKKLYQKFVRDLQNTNDEVKLRRQYNRSIQKLEREWEERLTVLENMQYENDFTVLSVSSDFFTLYDFMSEYAIYKLSKEGKIFYPTSVEERSKLISSIKIKDAVSIFLKNYKALLNQEEINYVSMRLL